MLAKIPSRATPYLPFVGGLDTTSQRLRITPGAVQAALNYEPDIQGGYRRIGGYEPFDGRPRASEASYFPLGNPSGFGVAASVGATAVGASSGATGAICYRGADWIGVADPVGTFTMGEQILVGGSPVGTYSEEPGSIDAFANNEALAQAATFRRAAIGAPTGSGITRVMALLGSVYAIRNNAGGTAAAVWKATTSGWVSVALLHEISFTAGTTAYAEGSTLSQGGVTATVKRVALASGDWTGGSPAVGRLIITPPSGGAFAAGAAAGGGACTLSGASTQITLQPIGKIDYDEANMVGNARRLYVCDGVNRAFEFDGSVLVPIDVPVSVKPSFVVNQGDYLFWGCGSDIAVSSVGDPYNCTPLTGGAQIGSGATLTGLMGLRGAQSTGAIFVGTTAGPKVLYGKDKDTFNLTALDSELAVQAWSMQPINSGMYLDTSGVRSLATTQSFGNYSAGLVSSQITSWLKGRTVSCSCSINSRTLMRLWFEDGSGLAGVPAPKGRMQWMPIDLGVVVRQMISSVIDGVERVFFTSDDGYVYEADAGRSFNGQPIEGWVMLHSFAAGSVSIHKSLHGITIESAGESAFEIQAQVEFNDGDPNVSVGEVADASSGPAGMRWDMGRWDAGVYDGGGVTSIRIPLKGNGASMALVVFSESDNELPHTLAGAIFNITPRRRSG